MSPKLGELLRAFRLAHSSAWLADCRESISDADLYAAWAKSHAAELQLISAIEELEAELASAKAIAPPGGAERPLTESERPSVTREESR